MGRFAKPASREGQVRPAIMYVRELLSDTNPDRSYHFRPPTPCKVVANYSTRVGYIWLDPKILRMLDLRIAKLNTRNPKNLTRHTLDNVPWDWGKCAAEGGRPPA